MTNLASPSPHAMYTPVCAVGASAGGVTALQNFFAHVDDNLGLAFVVIVHLAPDQPSVLSDILAGRTKMPVHQVDHSAQLKPNCVYVIPPDRELVIQGDDLTARPFSEPRGRRSPIDMFFRSVAAGRGDGMAVLLSGAGSDGTLGVRAIKEAGGVVFVQDPSEAEYSTMPESAIATGVADFVAPISILTTRVAEVTRSKHALRESDEEQAEWELQQIVGFLRMRTGHDFSNYKRATILRRIARRMQVSQQESLADYNRYLKSHPQEIQDLFSDLLISVTTFFRDPQAFDALAEKVVSPLFDRLDRDASLRVWVVGCATGEEAYSIGILLLEEAHRRGVQPLIQIFATDIDENALGTAREGRYPKAIENQMSEERLRRFFVADGPYYRVKQELRDLVLFAMHSALKDPPFIRVDLISCRNLLIYLQRELQRQLCSLFHYALKPGGYIFLGSAETMDAAPSSLFRTVDRDARLYAALTLLERAAPVLPQLAPDHRFLTAPKQPAEVEHAIGVGHAHAAALEQQAPPSALVDDSGRLLHLSPTVGRFFRPQEGPFSADLAAQVRPELRVDLKLALQRALQKGEATVTLPIPVAFNGGHHLVAIYVAPASAAGAKSASRAVVFFLDAGITQPVDEALKDEDVDRAEVKRLRQELSAAQDRLGAGRREYEQATQDLRAANEELQSINEEYRSTAEELETSKEELQSINEELQTLNGELKSKLATISASHDNLQNLIAATQVGTLFLDLDFKIKLFTPPISRYFNITEGDIGRVVSDFTHRLVYSDLERDARSVLKNLTAVEKEIRTSDGQWVSMQMRPYRTADNRIQGVVVTFADVTRLKLAEEGLAAELRATERLQQLSVKVQEADQPDAPLAAILDAMIELIGADYGHVQLYDKRSQTLRIAAQRGFDQRFLDHFAATDASTGLAWGAALADCQRVVVEDLVRSEASAPWLDEARAAGFRALISIPLRESGATLVGMLSIHFQQPHQFSEHDLRLVDIGARLAANAINAYQLQQALRDADRRKDEFLAMLAHELRNPLAPIYDSVKILKRDASLPAATVQRLLGVVEQQTTCLMRLVDDLLDVARITQGKIELRPEPVDLNQVLRSTVDQITAKSESKGQTIKVALAPEPMMVNGDPMRLCQVFSNVLNNASKYTPPGGHIDVAETRDGSEALIIVRDNGVGVAADRLPSIFELFTQGAQPLGRQSGIGVGLALARSIVGLHGGSIEALSEGAGMGSEFRIRLPLAAVRPISAKPQAEAAPDCPANSRRVLIVDDNQDVAESLALLAQTFGAEVKTAFNGPSALATISGFKPDIVMMDIGMPDMDGYELARKIREMPEGGQLVLAAVSGWAQDNKSRDADRVFDQRFVKPITVDALGALLTSGPRPKG